MLTGPITMLAWSFVRDDQPLADTARQLALALRDEVADLQAAGIGIIQIDEPGLRELLPLQARDQPEYLSHHSEAELKELQRSAVPFHVIINPKLTLIGNDSAQFFEGCLSVEGYQAIVDRALNVRVECLNERGEEKTINAHGWYARILQHEIDHLNGTLYIDRMKTRTLSTSENMLRYWHNQTIDEVLAELNSSA